MNVGNYQILPALVTQITVKVNELGLQSQATGQNFEEWLDKIHLLLHEIEKDIIPLGLHSLGKVLTGDELVEEVFTIVSSMTDIMDHMKTELYPGITVSYYDMNKVTLYTDELDAIDNQIRDYIERIVNGDEPQFHQH